MYQEVGEKKKKKKPHTIPHALGWLQGTWVWSLVRERGSHTALRDQACTLQLESKRHSDDRTRPVLQLKPDPANYWNK